MYRIDIQHVQWSTVPLERETNRWICHVGMVLPWTTACINKGLVELSSGLSSISILPLIIKGH